jgi:predicted CoA-substrate-specific enzyme activase
MTITEIKAFALGARALVPHCRTVLDIGGQDTKVISLRENGEVKNFEMNDKCAAGTGRFLEVMAKALGFEIEELGERAMMASKSVKINSMCTVFAESEVVSLTTQGEDRQNIAMGLHQAIVERTLAMLKHVGVETDFVFAGGVANNICIRKMLEERLGIAPVIPQNPQVVGALGAALHAAAA